MITGVFAGFHSGAVARGFHSDAVADKEEEVLVWEGGKNIGAAEDKAVAFGSDVSLFFIFSPKALPQKNATMRLTTIEIFSAACAEHKKKSVVKWKWAGVKYFNENENSEKS